MNTVRHTVDELLEENRRLRESFQAEIARLEQNLLDEFAMHALEGLLLASNGNWNPKVGPPQYGRTPNAGAAYQIAQSMLAERQRG